MGLIKYLLDIVWEFWNYTLEKLCDIESNQHLHM